MNFVTLFRSIFALMVLCLLISMSSCSLLKAILEPPSGPDSAPPTGYSQTFIKKSVQINSSGIKKPQISIAKVDISNPGKVKLYTHITDSTGAFLSGANNASFWCSAIDEVDGKPNKVKLNIKEVILDEKTPMAVSLVMDHSGSMGEERALSIQNAAELLINKKKNEDGMSLIKYDDHIETESAISTDKQTLLSQLKRNGLIGFGGRTAIIDGINVGMNTLMSSKGFKKKVVIVFTDGEDNSSTINQQDVIASAIKNNISICAIDFGYGVNGNFLKSISEATGGYYNRIYSTKEFSDVFEDMYRKLKQYYYLEYDTKQFGVHKLSIKFCTQNDSAIVNTMFSNIPDIGAIAVLDVFFDSDKSIVKNESDNAMLNVATLMKVYPGMEIEVRGHTDASNGTKDPNYNQKLSEKRAQAVKDYLQSKYNISSNRIQSKGFGDSMPIDDNSTEEGRARNRRTEIRIVKQ